MAFTFDQGELKLYLNGSLIQTSQIGLTELNSNDLYLGLGSSTSSYGGFKGHLDEWLITDGTKTSTEISSEFLALNN